MEDQLANRIAEIRQKQRAVGTCQKCSGTGVIAEFVYVNNGKCYDCRGTGVGADGLVTSSDG